MASSTLALKDSSIKKWLVGNLLLRVSCVRSQKISGFAITTKANWFLQSQGAEKIKWWGAQTVCMIQFWNSVNDL